MYKSNNTADQPNMKKRLAAKQMELYFDLAQEITGDCDKTLSLKTDNPEDILHIADERLKHYAGMIYTCSQCLTFTILRVSYKDGRFRVDMREAQF